MNENDLKLLLSRPETTGNSTLSVYLNVDQSRQANLNRGFETQLKEMMASLRRTISNSSELERFKNAAHRIEDFISTYQINARSIVVFFDESDGFLWHQELQVPMENQSRWNRELFLQPLAATIDESKAYVVALTGQAKLRLFVVFLGEIEEFSEKTFPSRQVRHIRTVGMDHIGSASQVQRKADEQVRWNLRHIVKDISGLMESKRLGRLVLAGTPETTAELRKLLPTRQVSGVIGIVDISTDATQEKVLAATQPIAEKHERDAELKIVDQVVTGAAKNGKVVTGLSHTLNAVNQARVWQLVYSEGPGSPGFECSKCAALFSVSRKSCLYCAAVVYPVKDVVERAVEHALRKGARIELVKGEASESLTNAGGIGAFLKSRTGSIRA
jgi:hypothetical protein